MFRVPCQLVSSHQSAVRPHAEDTQTVAHSQAMANVLRAFLARLNQGAVAIVPLAMVGGAAYGVKESIYTGMLCGIKCPIFIYLVLTMCPVHDDDLCVMGHSHIMDTCVMR